MRVKPLKTIEKKRITDVEYKGILLVKDWFQRRQLPKIYNNYYVVGRWFEYAEDDWEGCETLIITKSLKIAELVYKNYNDFKDDFSSSRRRFRF